jgi:hypothetical protein
LRFRCLEPGAERRFNPPQQVAYRGLLDVVIVERPSVQLSRHAFELICCPEREPAHPELGPVAAELSLERVAYASVIFGGRSHWCSLSYSSAVMIPQGQDVARKRRTALRGEPPAR